MNIFRRLYRRLRFDNNKQYTGLCKSRIDIGLYRPERKRLISICLDQVESVFPAFYEVDVVYIPLESNAPSWHRCFLGWVYNGDAKPSSYDELREKFEASIMLPDEGIG